MDEKKDEKKEAVSNLIPGLTPIDQSVLEAFLREMNDEVIPGIVKDVEERRLSAAESRQWQLKC